MFVLNHLFLIIVFFIFRLLDIGRRLDKSEKPALELIAQNLRRLKAIPLAAEIYQKLEDDKQVVQLHIEAEKWEDAFK